MFEGIEPMTKVFLENPLYGSSEFEVYTAEASLYANLNEVPIGEVRVYVPTEPELVTGEVLLGREIINKIKTLTLTSQERSLYLEV